MSTCLISKPSTRYVIPDEGATSFYELVFIYVLFMTFVGWINVTRSEPGCRL